MIIPIYLIPGNAYFHLPMNKIKTFSLARHGHLFDVPDSSKEYLFVQAFDHPYPEEPYRAESYALAFLKEGSINLQAGLTRYEIKAPAVLTLAPSVIRFFSKTNDLMKMDIIFFKDSFLLERHADLFFLMKYGFFENNDLHVLRLSEKFFQKVNSIFDLINHTQASAELHVAEVIRHYIFILIYELDAQQHLQQSENNTSVPVQPLFSKFRKLLSQNYMMERKLQFYADQLHVTPKYLSADVKKHTGKPAGEWIDETVSLEAKVLLQNKLLTVSQVSIKLNFPDQSTFGKFFKTNTGLSPLDYRKLF